MKYLQLILFFGLVMSENTFAFGYSGSSGSDGYDGQNGIDAKNIVIDGTDSGSYILNGTDGSYGSDGSSGSDASSCYQPTGYSDEYGASGGAGGDGGDGGRGGDGGDVTIFYKDINNLKNIQISNFGGLGKSGGNGASGGYPCTCSDYSWSHRSCRDVERCSTSQNCTTRRVCEATGETRTDGGVTAPVRVCHDRRSCNPVRSCHTENVCTTNNYSCSDGSRGSHGSRGSYGRDGYWGTIKLVKDISSLPAQTPSATFSLGELIQSPKTLSKQIWDKRTNAKNLFASDSQISGNYFEFIELAQRKIFIDWQAQRSFTELGDIKVKVVFDGKAITYKVIGEALFDLEVIESESQTKILVKNAYRTSEVTNLEIAKTKGYGKKLAIILKDNEALSEIVKTDIYLTLSYRRFLGGWRVAYDGKIPADKMTINKGRIEISVGSLGINPKHIKKRRRIRYSLKLQRTFGDTSKNVFLKQGKIKLR